MKSIFIVILLTLLSCCKTEELNKECSDLKSGFTYSNYSIIKPIFDSICQKYIPMPTNLDPLGHKKNTASVLKELQEKCLDIKIEMICYACLESLPVQSSFVVKLDSSHVEIIRHFSIYVPEGEVMYFKY